MKILKIYFDSFKGLSSESWMLALVMLINRAGSMVLPFLGVYMTDHLGFSIKHTGIILSFFGIGSVLGSWLGGLITDKLGEFKVQAFSLLLSVPLFCIIPLFTSEIGLAMIIMTQSAVSEAFRPANSVAITRYAKPGNITRAFSLNRMAVNLGFSIGPALGGILAAISYNFLFYCNATAALLAGLTYIAYFRNKNYRNEKPKTRDHVKKEVSPYKDSVFMAFCLVTLAFSVCFFQFVNTLPIFYQKNAHLNQQEIGYLLAYSGLVIVLLEMLFVQIAERKFSLRFTLFIGTLLCGASFLMLAFDVAVLVLVFSMTILCIGEIWTLPFMATVTAMRSGDQNKGAYMGLLGIAFSISFIITPLLGTQIAETFGFQILWISTAIAMILSALAYYFLIPKLLVKSNSEHSEN